MSQFKVGRIIADHGIWFAALTDWIRKGHSVVFVIGNHDLELCWPSVQNHIREALHLTEQEQERLRFCDFFYISGEDTYISHGHLYDPYCTVRNPINPLISVAGRPRVRIPFGDLAERYMLNGMGYFNPHATSNFIMSFGDYVRFFVKYMLRTQPLLLWTWFWSASVTFIVTLRDFILLAMRDPLRVDEKVQGIADRANATPSMVRQLNALHVPSACTHPLKIIRELWLDRGLLFLVMLYGAFQFIVTINFLVPIEAWWLLLLIALLFPLFLLYSFSIQPKVFVDPLLNEKRADLLATITGVRRAVMGHTHMPESVTVGPIEYLNGGFWSPAFAEPECIHRIGTQTFVWLGRSSAEPSAGQGRAAEIHEWPPGAQASRLYDPALVAEKTPVQSVPEKTPEEE